jgi:hypothetical protein
MAAAAAGHPAAATPLTTHFDKTHTPPPASPTPRATRQLVEGQLPGAPEPSYERERDRDSLRGGGMTSPRSWSGRTRWGPSAVAAGARNPIKIQAQWLQAAGLFALLAGLPRAVQLQHVLPSLQPSPATPAAAACSPGCPPPAAARCSRPRPRCGRCRRLSRAMRRPSPDCSATSLR